MVGSIRWAEGVLSGSVPFSLRVRLGHCEVEISGSRDEVLQTMKDLPSLVAAVSEAFAGAEAFSNLSSANSSPSPSASSHVSASSVPTYPSIQSGGGCGDAVLRLLGTDWGRVAPRTLPEIVEALRVNAVHFPVTTLSGVLNWLVRKGRVKRWRTDKGYVYVLATRNADVSRGQAEMQADVVLGSGGV